MELLECLKEKTSSECLDTTKCREGFDTILFARRNLGCFRAPQDPTKCEELSTANSALAKVCLPILKAALPRSGSKW